MGGTMAMPAVWLAVPIVVKQPSTMDGPEHTPLIPSITAAGIGLGVVREAGDAISGPGTRR